MLKYALILGISIGKVNELCYEEVTKKKLNQLTFISDFSEILIKYLQYDVIYTEIFKKLIESIGEWS
jgi:hypothetical protein